MNPNSQGTKKLMHLWVAASGTFPPGGSSLNLSPASQCVQDSHTITKTGSTRGIGETLGSGCRIVQGDDSNAGQQFSVTTSLLDLCKLENIRYSGSPFSRLFDFRIFLFFIPNSVSTLPADSCLNDRITSSLCMARLIFSKHTEPVLHKSFRL